MILRDLVLFSEQYESGCEGVIKILPDIFLSKGGKYEYIVNIYANDFNVNDGIEVCDKFINKKLNEFKFDSFLPHYYLIMLGDNVGGFYPQNIAVTLDFTIKGKIDYIDWIIKSIIE